VLTDDGASSWFEDARAIIVVENGGASARAAPPCLLSPHSPVVGPAGGLT
jgi:hypothetical protein